MNTKRSNAKCQDLDIGNISPEDLRSKVNVHFGDSPSMFTKQGHAKSTDVRSKANVNHSDRANPNMGESHPETLQEKAADITKVASVKRLDRTTPKRSVLKSKLANIIDRYGNQLMRYASKTQINAGTTRTGCKLHNSQDLSDPMYLAKMGSKPDKICSCRNPLSSHHDDVHVGNKSPIRVTENEAHLMDATSNTPEPKQTTFDRTKTKRPKLMIVMCDQRGNTWGSRWSHRRRLEHGHLIPYGFRYAQGGKISGRVRTNLMNSKRGIVVKPCIKNHDARSTVESKKSVRFHDDCRSRKNVKRSERRTMKSELQDTSHVGVTHMKHAPSGMGDTIRDERNSQYTRGMSATHVTKLNRALHEIQKLKSRIRELQRRNANAMASTQTGDANNGFVLDSGASMHILKRKKWLRKILNRHRVIIRDAAGNSHKCDETGSLCMRIRTCGVQNATPAKAKLSGSLVKLLPMSHASRWHGFDCIRLKTDA